MEFDSNIGATIDPETGLCVCAIGACYIVKVGNFERAKVYKTGAFDNLSLGDVRFQDQHEAEVAKQICCRYFKPLLIG